MGIKRIGKHLLEHRWRLRRIFPPKSLARIEQAIKAGEATHSGQVRFVVEGALDGAPLFRNQPARERALDIFSQLRIWDTVHNNGVLIYLLLADQDFEIVADRGIDTMVGHAGWENICQEMEADFRVGAFRTRRDQGNRSRVARTGRTFSEGRRRTERAAGCAGGNVVQYRSRCSSRQSVHQRLVQGIVVVEVSRQGSQHRLETYAVGGGIVGFTDAFAYLRGAAINSPCRQWKIGIIDDRQGAPEVLPRFIPIADGKSDTRQQAMGECEMVLVRCRGGVVAQLDRPSSRLIEFGNLQTIFAQAVIELRGNCKVQWNAILFEAALNIDELLACPLRVAQSHESLRQDRSLKEISKLVFVESSLVDAFAEGAGSLKIHCFDVQPCERQTAQCAGLFISVFSCHFQRRRGFALQIPPLAQMKERGGLQHVEKDKDVNISGFAGQALSMRRRVATLPVPRPPAVKNALDPVTPDQRAVVLCAGTQLHCSHATSGILLVPSLEIQVDAGAAALYQGLEGVVLQGLAFGQHIFGRLKAGASVCMQAEPANGKKAGDLLPKLAGVSGADNHLLEITN